MLYSSSSLGFIFLSFFSLSIINKIHNYLVFLLLFQIISTIFFNYNFIILAILVEDESEPESTELLDESEPETIELSDSGKLFTISKIIKYV
jgi:hypothetical protein